MLLLLKGKKKKKAKHRGEEEAGPGLTGPTWGGLRCWGTLPTPSPAHWCCPHSPQSSHSA